MSLGWLEDVAWNKEGLIPAIAQEDRTGQVLMLAWMNREALETTVQSGYAVYWSRSRKRLWRKGEQSGHEQIIKAIHLDCDSDAVLLLVEQKGGMACHTGRHRCFFKRLEKGNWASVEPVLKSPDSIYNNSDE
ncbi:phosphoribosyl-AMP cyclohydrolase [Nitrosococcus oceani]|uniref:Phosphoribosyl-AMP cyclohydrolase n=2 Tax=Nitrosococcus oceani TaxID=1229 RepID=HIS3_NITOC|nr:phosphoribosyl-AMP cyclohydrolase [Nitrosococcus oceani]Q3J6Q0.1 RecName: Full=Phosphoribosyl-AMP cyclohydrolase; Short=PRA-CH [Nitrosococcus oceani ATCC 19707]KFI18063.1 phosphoribosyl-AMP cyclohydrolase [Nitrosococcus oceani C-27]ABA59496.1 phosphoribosyl-AMP cyclohydrolase [Nitrosococcus oceani ATCC 19707]EDZ66090.1 phosphoribosyl-AMP cyclohydrolase domain protein [Nitrosococcus oceani AFC27]KFI21302.1 phosphoribosyl-AMP cyclohydrolase [Nitrosococcus oceani]GEM21376.1 phosphoribosyl-AMP